MVKYHGKYSVLSLKGIIFISQKSQTKYWRNTHKGISENTCIFPSTVTINSEILAQCSKAIHTEGKKKKKKKEKSTNRTISPKLCQEFNLDSL